MDQLGPPFSDCQKQSTCIESLCPSDGRRCRAFGPRAMSRASSTTRVFRSDEKGPSDDPARPGVENDREVEKAGQRRQEGDVGHPQRVRPLGHEVAADEIAGGMMIPRLPRRDRCASAPATPAIPAARINRAIRFRPTIRLSAFSSGMNTRRAIGSMRPGVDRADATRQIGVGGRPSRNRSAPPGIIARGRNPQDAGHCTKGKMAWCALMNR